MELEISKFDHFGGGISKYNNKVVFVNKALPKEIVDVKVTYEKKNYCEAEIVNIKKENKDRINPVCPYYDKCGGCNFLHTKYELEKEFKINKAKELLERCDNFFETKYLNYRNKCTLHVKDNKIGYYEKSTNTIISINYCYLLSNRINKVIHDLNNLKIDKYDIKKVIIKEHNNNLLLDIDGIVDNDFINYFNYVDTIICNNKVLKGNGYIEEIIDNKVFKITGNAFFQVNKEGLVNINKIIKKYLKNKVINNALDLYSGTSLWGILISDYVSNVTCIEINKESCDNGIINLKRNNIQNINIINGKVENYIDTFKNIDLIIIDPPRSGLDKKTIDYLKRIKANYLIYISCDMLTLKRDLEYLKEIYNINEINLVDMFMRTYHCESLVILERK